MARYIDADALYEKLYPLDLVDKRLYSINAKAVADAIAKTPTADVVPKSEVIDDFVKRLLDAFPEPHRGGNLCPAIYYDDYREIIEELAEEMKGGEADES